MPRRSQRPKIPRRVLAAWLPWWATERRIRDRPDVLSQPLVIIREDRRGLAITALNPQALSVGLDSGMPLADARAIVPDLLALPADPAGDARALERLARWANRFAPHIMTAGRDTIVLSIGGSAHLFGGEGALATSLKRALGGFGLTVRLALADTVGAAWALARHGPEEIPSAPPGATAAELRETLGALPVAALRLRHDVVCDLSSFGINHIHSLARLEPAQVIERFGWSPIRRLEQALGLREEPITPLRELPGRDVRRAFADPVCALEGIRKTVDNLLDDLCRELGRAGEGTRALRLTCKRADGKEQTLTVGTCRPLRNKKALVNLVSEKLGQLEVGFGVDEIVLTSDTSQAMDDVQADCLAPADARPPGSGASGADLGTLLDRLGNRFGFDRVSRPVPRASWLPERAVRHCEPWGPRPAASLAGDEPAWPPGRARPLRLLSPPEAIKVTDRYDEAGRTWPAHFRRRGRLHRVLAARGPERLACEWWRQDAPTRDYYLIEDDSGQRYWLFCLIPKISRTSAPWFLHGIFA